MTILDTKTTPPAFHVPAGACDCHVHIFGPQSRFPLEAKRLYTPAPVSMDDLASLQEALHLERAVVVQASPQGTDNACLLEALSQRPSSTRGIAVVGDDIGHDALAAMSRVGVRGIRLNLETYGIEDPVAVGARLKAAAERVAPLGWHIQLYARASLLAALADLIAGLPCPIVADHFGRVRAADGVDHPDLRVLLALVRTGKVYVKLSAPHRISDRADYADVEPIAVAFTEAAPERMLWGSDWPHSQVPPRSRRSRSGFDPYRTEDDGANLNRLARWIPDPGQLRRILFDNPARLYSF